MSVIEKRKSFPVNIEKFLKTTNLKNICKRLPLKDIMCNNLEDLMKV